MCKFIREEESTENKLVTVYYISPTPQGKAGKGNTMAEFEAITTQEAFDNAIKARLDRNTDTVKKQFEGYISPDDFKTKTADLNSKITDLTGKLAEKDTAIADLTAKNKAYETSSVKMRVAREKGLPYEAVEFITGEDEESIGKSADALKGLFKGSRAEPPTPNPEGSGRKEHDDNESYRKALKKLRGGNE